MRPLVLGSLAAALAAVLALVGGGVGAVPAVAVGAVAVAALRAARRESEQRLFRRVEELERSLARADDERTDLARAVDDRRLELERKNAELELALAELSGAQGRLVQGEKMASLGQMAAGVAHEFNNPAQHLIANLPYLQRGIERLRGVVEAALAVHPDDPASRGRLERAAAEAKLARTNADLDEILEALGDGATRIGELVRDLTTFSRLDAAELREVDLHEGIEAAARLLGYRFKDRVRIERDYAELPRIRCQAGQLNHVFMNLLANAADAIPGEGTVWVKTEHEGDVVRVRFTDDGEGMEPAVLERIFDPFFTTKEPGAGTGLGLATAYDVVRRHGGSITARSDPGVGTVFTVELPVRPPPAAAPAPEPT